MLIEFLSKKEFGAHILPYMVIIAQLWKNVKAFVKKKFKNK